MIITSLDNSCPGNVLRSCANLYCEIWKEPPWEETFWTTDGVIADLRKQIGKPGARGFLAVEGEEVVGFTWGYVADIATMREISGGESLDFIFQERKQVFYLSELGVHLAFRQHKVGERLSRHLLDDVAGNGDGVIVLRTDVKAVAARKLYQKLGFMDLSLKDNKHQNRTYWILSNVPAPISTGV